MKKQIAIVVVVVAAVIVLGLRYFGQSTSAETAAGGAVPAGGTASRLDRFLGRNEAPSVAAPTTIPPREVPPIAPGTLPPPGGALPETSGPATPGGPFAPGMVVPDDRFPSRVPPDRQVDAGPQADPAHPELVEPVREAPPNNHAATVGTPGLPEGDDETVEENPDGEGSGGEGAPEGDSGGEEGAQ
jgi:hypothetical protein